VVGYPGLDQTALEFFRTLLFWLTCMFAGAALLGLSIYGALLCVEIFSPRPCSKARLTKVPHPPGGALVAEKSFDSSAAETTIPAEAERLGEEVARVPALSHDVEMPMTWVPRKPEGEPTGP
jgi:hypothetical protein